MNEGRVTPRPLGRTGIQVTPLGVAAMSVRPSSGSKFTADDVERAFYDFGINTFLVHFMMKQLSEGIRRLIRAGHRHEIVLASEVALPWAGSVRRGLEKHLRTFGTDHMDIWLLGWLRKRWYAREDVWSAMGRLRDEGKTRAIGYSSHDRVLAASLARELPADVIMIRYNAAHRGAERDIFTPLAELGDRRPGIIAYTATRWRMLLKPMPEHGFAQPMTAPECYRFVLGHPMVDAAWCAPANMQQLGEDVHGVLEGPLDPDRKAEICRFGDAVHANARGGLRWMFGPTST